MSKPKKPKVGRPRKGATVRSVTLIGRVEPRHKLEFSRAAKRAGKILWDWVLDTLMEAMEKSKAQAQAECLVALHEGNKKMYSALKQSVIESNIRQIAEWKAEAEEKAKAK